MRLEEPVGDVERQLERRAIFSFTLAALLLVGLLAVSLPSLAIDVDPGDWETAPAGTTAGFLYGQHVERSQLYSKGNVAVSNSQLNSDVGILRYVHWTTLADRPFAPNILIPFGRMHADGSVAALGQTSGMGDVVLVFPYWLISQTAQREYFSISPYVYLPTGSYDKNRPLNLGENRSKFDLQFGYQRGIGSALNIELAADVMEYGRNSDVGLSQKPLYEIEGYLSYDSAPGTRLAVGLFHTFGGDQVINGLDQNNRIRTTKANVTASTFFSPKDQLLLTFGKDLQVENGFKEDRRFNFRLLHIF
jgi:hypothetical protein